jgi:hypothetical protein
MRTEGQLFKDAHTLLVPHADSAQGLDVNRGWIERGEIGQFD